MVLRALQERLLIPLARAAADFREQTGWQTFGYTRVEDHARERFHRSGRWVRSLAELHRAMGELPAVRTALTGEDGGAPIGFRAALLIGGVATTDSAPAWVDLARRVSVRRLRDQVRAARERGSGWPPRAEEEGTDAVAGGGGAGGGGTTGAGEAVGDDDPAARVLVQFPIPLPGQALFDEALDLFRAVEGREAASVTSFIEALVAEAYTGPAPPDVECTPLPPRRRDGPAAEQALEEATGNWQHLAPCRPAADLGGPPPAADHEAPAPAAADPDARIRHFIRMQDDIERRLGRLLARMSDEKAWSRLGFTGLAHYAEQRLGLCRSSAQDRAHLARALRRRPLLRAAYESGQVGFRAALSVVRTLGNRPASPEVEAEWVERAARATVKRLDDESRAIKRREAGLDEPTAPPAAGAGFTPPGSARPAAAGSTQAADPGAATAVSSGRRVAPRPLDDAAWSASLVRRVGTARRRLADFRRLAFQGDAALTLFRLHLPEELAGDFLGAIEAARRRVAADPARICSIASDGETSACVALDDAASASGITGGSGTTGARCAISTRMCATCRTGRVSSWVGLMVLLEDFILTWDVNQYYRRPGEQAVYGRDGWRCRAPGCTGRCNLEKHHVQYRSQLGSDDDWNMATLCAGHHRQGEHGEFMDVRGKAPLGLRWSLGRGGCGGQFRNELRLAGVRRRKGDEMRGKDGVPRRAGDEP